MTRYELFKFLHIVGATAWVGGGIGLTIFAWRLRIAGDLDALVKMGDRSKELGNYLFVPASLLTLGFGIAMVATESFLGFTDLWILIGFGGIALSGVAEMAIAQPAAKRLTAAAETHGPGSPEALAAAARSTFGNVVGVAILVAVIWAMVAKPIL